MTEIVIRPLQASDQDDWEQLWTSYLMFYKTTLPRDVYKTAFSRLLSEDPHEFNCLIAELGGRPVGLAHYLFHRTLWSIEDTCYLMDLFTVPEVRGSGAGRALIEAVHEAARSNGIPDVYWHTQEGNQRARSLYDTLATQTDFLHYEKKA